MGEITAVKCNRSPYMYKKSHESLTRALALGCDIFEWKSTCASRSHLENASSMLFWAARTGFSRTGRGLRKSFREGVSFLVTVRCFFRTVSESCLCFNFCLSLAARRGALGLPRDWFSFTGTFLGLAIAPPRPSPSTSWEKKVTGKLSRHPKSNPKSQQTWKWHWQKHYCALLLISREHYWKKGIPQHDFKSFRPWAFFSFLTFPGCTLLVLEENENEKKAKPEVTYFPFESWK